MAKQKSQATTQKKAIFVLENRHIGFIGRVAAEIQGNTGAVVQKSEILRAMITAVMASKIDLSSATSEAEIAGILSKKLKR